MKKLISSILALSLVAGMSVTAFATVGDVVGFGYGTITENYGNVTLGSTFTVIVPYSSIDVEYEDTATAVGTLNATNARTAFTTSTTPGSTKWNATLNAATDVTVQSISATANGLEVKLKALSGSAYAGTIFSVVYDLLPGGTVAGTGTPTVTSATLTINGTYVAAATGIKIDDVIGGSGDAIGTNAGVWTTGMATNYGSSTGNTAGPNDLNNLDIRPDAEIFLRVNSDDFEWIDSNDNSANPSTPQKVTTSQLRTGKITVKKSVSKGSNTIENIEFDSDSYGAYVHVEFVEWFVSVDDQDVDFTVYLARKGSKRSDTEVNIAGTMDNEQDEVDEGDDYISTEDGTVFEAQDYVRNCEVYLGNGVYITTNLFKDKKYYGIALNTYDTTDGAIMDEYPEIDNVLTLKTVNLKGSGNIVSFDMSGDYYVYGADGTYLGLSSENVAYSDKYYFATERISINDGDLDDDDDLILDEDDDDDYVGPSDGGGDDANNANDNPGTGVNGFVGVAVAAGLISLAAVGVTARKKK